MSPSLPHEAIVLAGGLGSRLQSVVSDRPKPLAEVIERPFITHLFDQISRWGIRVALLAVGHLAERAEALLGKRYGALELRYAREAQPLGTGGALRNALAFSSGEQLLVMNGDSYCGIDGTAFMEAHARSGAPVTMALLAVRDAARAGIVEVAADGSVVRFAPRPDRLGEGGLINAGIYAFRRETITAIPSGSRVSLEEQVFPQLAGKGLRGWNAGPAPFIDIGTPESYAAAAGFFAALPRVRG